jgi:DNA polymerase-1
VVQASAADWAAVLLAALRRRLVGGGAPGAELVFFQHDEVMLHCPEEVAPAAATLLTEAAEEASRLVFGPTPVRFPLEVAAVRCYADAK